VRNSSRPPSRPTRSLALPPGQPAPGGSSDPIAHPEASVPVLPPPTASQIVPRRPLPTRAAPHPARDDGAVLRVALSGFPGPSGAGVARLGAELPLLAEK
jgi:hypothetical protein